MFLLCLSKKSVGKILTANPKLLKWMKERNSRYLNLIQRHKMMEVKTFQGKKGYAILDYWDKNTGLLATFTIPAHYFICAFVIHLLKEVLVVLIVDQYHDKRQAFMKSIKILIF